MFNLTLKDIILMPFSFYNNINFNKLKIISKYKILLNLTNQYYLKNVLHIGHKFKKIIN